VNKKMLGKVIDMFPSESASHSLERALIFLTNSPDISEALDAHRLKYEQQTK